MPKEIRSSVEFERIAPSAQECRVVRAAETVKLKLRTPEYLYVYKTNEDEAEGLLKGLKEVEVLEITPSSSKKEENAKDKKEITKDKVED